MSQLRYPNHITVLIRIASTPFPVTPTLAEQNNNILITVVHSYGRAPNAGELIQDTMVVCGFTLQAQQKESMMSSSIHPQKIYTDKTLISMLYISYMYEYVTSCNLFSDVHARLEFTQLKNMPHENGKVYVRFQ